MKIILGMLAAALLLLVLGMLELQSRNSQLESELTQLRFVLEKHQRTQQSLLARHKAEVANLEQMLAVARKRNEQMVDQLTAAADSVEKDPLAELPSPTEEALAQVEKARLEQNLEQKYRVLLPELALSGADKEKLTQLLLDRERVLGSSVASYYTDDAEIELALRRQQFLLEEIDQAIAELLDAQGYQRYEMVKDSDFEQYQLKQFGNVLGPDVALTDDQSRSLLFVKLRSKQDYQEALEQAAELAKNGEQRKALQVVELSVETYKNNYLQEARQLLSDNQFQMLRDYEVLQFEQMLRSLKSAYQDP